jgi:ADP-dependent NAD(P)H-hydrate dehydratase / NAD(P)H-hydrate epimerase
MVFGMSARDDEGMLPLEPLWTAEQARDADRWTIEALGVPGSTLMDQAGRLVADAACGMAEGGSVVVLAGPGNNGGDGWVCARHLFARGVPTLVLAIKEPHALAGDARDAAASFERAAQALGWRAPDDGRPWRRLATAAELADALVRFRPAVVVDALFGTGLQRPLTGLTAELVLALDEAGAQVLAVDLPSGLPTDGAAPMGPCVRAARTLTFSGPKIAHAAEPGRFYCGDVANVDIGVLRHARLLAAARSFLAPALEDLALPLPSSNSHKGRFGHVAILAGSAETAGAARLCARAALRAGAGLVTLLTDDPARLSAGDEPEVMRRLLDEADAAQSLEKVSVVVVGPGLGRGAATLARGRAVLRAAAQLDLPAIVDADALRLLHEPELRGLRCIATPHPGEAGALLGDEAAAVQSDRGRAAARLAALTSRTTWVLKGACPVVALPSGRQVIAPGGHLPLAVGGSGDVLAGVLAALAALGIPLPLAALAGVVAHQEAGALLAEEGRRGHLAREIADAVAAALEEAWAS